MVKKYRLNVCVINAGIGPLENELKKIVHKTGLDQNFFFLGAIPNEDIIRFMKFCTYFVMTSERVVFDMAILEALASRTIVLANNDGGNKEILKDGVNGYLFFKNEPEEIADRILNADKNIVKGAEETVRRFSLGSMAEKYLELYNN
jgi:glycosyltransferase involved in cell wall biosynthesis